MDIHIHKVRHFVDIKMAVVGLKKISLDGLIDKPGVSSDLIDSLYNQVYPQVLVDFSVKNVDICQFLCEECIETLSM